jgi:hypothetical protein
MGFASPLPRLRERGARRVSNGRVRAPYQALPNLPVSGSPAGFTATLYLSR